MAAAELEMVSEYVRGLSPLARQRYIEKLRILGLTERDDPYSSWNESKFVDDMCLWPAVEYGHNYLLLFCGASGCLYSAGAHAVEELGGLQLLCEWECA